MARLNQLKIEPSVGWNHARPMQLLYRSPDGHCWYSEEDCLAHEASMPQEYWDRVNALQAFKQARLALKERDRKEDQF